MRDPDTGEERLARVKVPEGLPRFMRGRRPRAASCPLEDVIAHFLGSLFPQMEISEPTVFRLTRDADFEVSDEADDLLEAVRARARAGAVSATSSASRSRIGTAEPMLERLKRGPRRRPTTRSTTCPGCSTSPTRWSSPQLDRPELKDEPWVPVTPSRFARRRRA